MEPKTQASLLFLLEGAANNEMLQLSQQEWKQSYKDFCVYLEHVASGDNIIAVMRTVEHMRIELTALQAEFVQMNKQEHIAASLCSKALDMVRMEIHMLDLRLQYPELLLEKRPKMTTLYLSSEYTLTDLVELIVALYELEVFRTKDGRKAHLINIVRIFEVAFNISMPNYGVLRLAALNRKIHTTHFIDKLRSKIIELSQR